MKRTHLGYSGHTPEPPRAAQVPIVELDRVTFRAYGDAGPGSRRVVGAVVLASMAVALWSLEPTTGGIALFLAWAIASVAAMWLGTRPTRVVFEATPHRLRIRGLQRKDVEIPAGRILAVRSGPRALVLDLIDPQETLEVSLGRTDSDSLSERAALLHTIYERRASSAGGATGAERMRRALARVLPTSTTQA